MAQRWCALALAALGFVAGGCREGASGADAGRADARDVRCLGAAVCDGTSVRACRMGRAAEVLQECAPTGACSLGRCTSSACARVEADRPSLVGCAFYTFDLDNVTSDDSLPTSVLVTNGGQVAATLTLEQRQAATWVGTRSLIVAPMRSARFVLPDSHFEGGGLAAHGAFRLTSDLPVSAAHVQSDDSAPGGSRSTGGTLLLPAHVLGRRYRALTYAQAATPRLVDTPGARGGAGQLVIVGSEDGTNVTISPSQAAALEPAGGAPGPGPDGKLHVTLDDGDLFTIYSSREGADLTGTEVAADEPVAVFSGNISTTYGVTATGISSPDMAHEQLLPVAAWGLSYVAAQLTPQAGVCDPLFGPGASLWTILADGADTHVRFQSPSGASPSPERTLGEGEAFRFSAAGDFVIRASHPIQVMQGMDCEPSLSSAVPTTALLGDYRFSVLPNFGTMMAIVRMAGQPVFFDGARIEDSLFDPVGGGFDVARIPLEACPPAAGVCTHHLEGRFGFTMRGMDVLASYALTAPTWPCPPDAPLTGCIN